MSFKMNISSGLHNSPFRLCVYTTKSVCLTRSVPLAFMYDKKFHSEFQFVYIRYRSFIVMLNTDE